LERCRPPIPRPRCDACFLDLRGGLQLYPRERCGRPGATLVCQPAVCALGRPTGGRRRPGVVPAVPGAVAKCRNGRLSRRPFRTGEGGIAPFLAYPEAGRAVRGTTTLPVPYISPRYAYDAGTRASSRSGLELHLQDRRRGVGWPAGETWQFRWRKPLNCLREIPESRQRRAPRHVLVVQGRVVAPPGGLPGCRPRTS